jgi:hypothetical protein
VKLEISGQDRDLITAGDTIREKSGRGLAEFLDREHHLRGCLRNRPNRRSTTPPVAIRLSVTAESSGLHVDPIGP